LSFTPSQIEETVSRLKAPPKGKICSRLPVTTREGEARAFLRPVFSPLAGDVRKDAGLIARWRNKHRESFFTWFEATEETTLTWLAEHYAQSLDLIFMVETLDREPFAYLSLYDFDLDRRSCWFGRMVRGLETGPRGGLTLAVSALLDWAFQSLGIKTIFLEVFEHNLRALALYHRIGFKIVRRIPLRRIDQGAVTKWEPSLTAGDPDGYSLRMVAVSKASLSEKA